MSVDDLGPDLDGVDPDEVAPGPVASVLLVAVAGLLLLYLVGILLTDWAFSLAGPFTSLLIVGVVALWIRGYL